MQQERTTTKDADKADAASHASSAPPDAELEDYRRQLTAVERDARDLLDGLTDAHFNWRAAPGRWSIGECLAHLNLTGQVYLQKIDRAIRRGRSEGLLGRGPYKHGWFGKIFLRATEPPVKMTKVKAPKTVAPPPEHLLAVAAPAFMSLQDALRQKMAEAEGVDLGRVRITSLFLKLLRLSLGQSFAVVIAHERRHLWQARQVRNDPNFPA